MVSPSTFKWAKACFEQFDALDVDCSGTLEPLELLPVIQLICQTQEPGKRDEMDEFFAYCLGVGVTGKQFSLPVALITLRECFLFF